MSETAICDTQSKSRKGRKPISDQAMTAAERKQRQRNKAKADRRETPSWLRLRRDIWQLVQERFMLANAAELADALNAISTAIVFTNAWRINGATDENLVKFIAVALGNREPDELIRSTVQEVLPYKLDERTDRQLPGYSKAILHEVIRDILNGSRIDDDEQQTADVEE